MTRAAILMAMASLLLTGCETKEEAAARISKQLPAGCELLDLGSYPGIDSLVAIRCPNSTVTTNGAWTRHEGKMTRRVGYAVALETKEGRG